MRTLTSIAHDALTPNQSIPITFPAGLGEPLNAILAGTSDDAVLKDSEVDGGLRNYFLYVNNCTGLIV
jgi:hypothetical protein